MRLTAPSEPIAVAANGEAEVTVLVRNDRDIVDGFGATLTGISVEDVRSESVALFPGVEADVRVAFRVPPTVPAGARQALVEVRSRADGTSTAVPITLVVPARRFVTGEFVPATLATYHRASTTLVLRNHGNVAVPLNLAVADPAGELHLDLAVDLVELPPRASVRIPLTITGRRRVAGIAIPTTFAATGRGEGDELLVSAGGMFTVRPLLPRWVLTFLPLLLVLAAWALILVFAVGKAVNSAVPAHSTVAGRVVSTGPQPLPVGNAAVGAYPTDGSSAMPVASTTTKPDGSFSLPVAPGDYVLRAGADGFDPDPVDGVAKVKAEKGRRAPEVELRLDGKPGSIAGSVTGAGEGVTVAAELLDAQGNAVPAGSTATTIALRLAALRSDGSDDPSTPDTATTTTARPPTTAPSPLPPAKPSATATTDAKGTFTMSGLAAPATYRLRFNRPGYQEAVVVVSLAAGESKTGVVAPLAPVPGTITGTVTAGGGPAGGVDIAVTNGAATFTTKSVAGSYTVEGVPPGTWVVSAAYGTLPPATASVVVTPGGRHVVPTFAF